MSLSLRSALPALQQQPDKPVLVKFIAPHCGGCKTIKPILELIAQQNADQLNLAEVDITDYPELAMELDVRSVPTVALFRQEQEVGRLVGVHPKQQYFNLVNLVCQAR